MSNAVLGQQVRDAIARGIHDVPDPSPEEVALFRQYEELLKSYNVPEEDRYLAGLQVGVTIGHLKARYATPKGG